MTTINKGIKKWLKKLSPKCLCLFYKTMDVTGAVTEEDDNKIISFLNSCDGAHDSLDVRFTKTCDNRCSFCIERKGIDALPESSADDLIAQTIKSDIKNILILGGEPFLYPEKLFKYVAGIRNHVDSIYITTSLPETFIADAALVGKIIDLIDGLNVSIQSIGWAENNAILKATSRHNRLDLLRSLNKKHADKTRVSINLVRHGIDNKEKLTGALSYLESIGTKFIKINEMQGQRDLYVSFEDIMNIRMKSPFAHGCSKIIHIDGYCSNAEILLKRSCFAVESSKTATVADLIKVILKSFHRGKNKFAVLYEDGSLHNTWETKNI